ncbi:MAG: hypothetical protein JWQ81_7537 [Amycolatopsis sp.]|uniref:DUF4387 domain-containing protein n=1 Tax=Amycolatopsis sp. TaxID=37632 RepID=UPI00260CB5A2|nr:DUF4387 domain-containing protein [Amycolatopsis sp.]MCU1686798.1 hypothetical protein [Amycolatopsis sp.]
MIERNHTVGDQAALIRTKNAGPFWMTIDIFFATDAAYQYVAESGALTENAVARLYQTDPAAVLLYRLPAIRVIKASFPRPVVQGSFADRDMHSGQQHVPVAGLVVPAPRAQPA